MMNKGKRIGVMMGLTVVFLILATGGSLLTARCFTAMKQADAEIILELTRKNIQEMFTASRNEAMLIVEQMGGDPDNTAQFREAAGRALTKEGVSRIYLVKGTTVADVVDAAVWQEEIGKGLEQFPYIVNVARLRQQTVVEGPVELTEGEESFLFIEPILSGADYLGQVMVVEDSDHVLSHLGLSQLREQGYDYELWRIDAQDGEKRVVDVSDPDRDMSDAVRATFFLPTQWTLAIRPVDGWVSAPMEIIAGLVGVLIFAFFAVCSYAGFQKRAQLERDAMLRDQDGETGLFNRSGFVRVLNEQIEQGLTAYTLIIFAMDEYIPLARVMEEEQRRAYLDYVIDQLNDYTDMPHIYGRISEGCYVLAALADLTDRQAKELAKELALELLWKTQVRGCRAYIHARWSALRCPADGTGVEELLREGMRRFDEKYYPRCAEDTGERE